ncbi:YIP1 family protein [Nocardiopsis sp. YSL2]|uniref:YIP1 family protein n=1 Tax=Nocardiopsis sp. YSL2 TaxID=2939492 RepID=UPI0026F42C30|nr:YIP1 family protein [Nocardiopsis sp. YSL2]
MLRHLVGLLAGVALAPVLRIAVAWGATVLPLAAEGTVSFATVSAVIVLAAVGTGCGYLVASRLSPLYAGVAGALLTAIALWPVVAPDSMASALGWLDSDGFVYPAGAGLTPALVVGALMLFSAMVPSRWRARHEAPAPGGRFVAGASRERFRGPADRDTLVEGVPASDDRDVIGGAREAGESATVDDLPDTPPVPLPPPHRGFGDGDGDGDPDKTTTPFRRGEAGSVWTPLDDGPEETRTYGDGRA